MKNSKINNLGDEVYNINETINIDYELKERL